MTFLYSRKESKIGHEILRVPESLGVLWDPVELLSLKIRILTGKTGLLKHIWVLVDLYRPMIKIMFRFKIRTYNTSVLIE